MALPFTQPVPASEECLSLERASERREYWDYWVSAMTGESLSHRVTCFNLAGTMHAQLTGTRCRGFSPRMKVRSGDRILFACPDLAMVCGELRSHDEHGAVFVNPTAIFESLSPSTGAYARSEKFERYTTIDKDYVLIAQDRPRGERFSRRADGTWERAELDGVSEVPSLRSIVEFRWPNCTTGAVSQANERRAWQRKL